MLEASDTADTEAGAASEAIACWWGDPRKILRLTLSLEREEIPSSLSNMEVFHRTIES